MGGAIFGAHRAQDHRDHGAGRLAQISAALMHVRLGNIDLYCGDMRQVLPQLKARADLILSDPPYRLTAGGNTTGEMGGIFARGAYDNSGELFPVVPWEQMAPLLWSACAPDADLICMTSDRESHDARAALQSAGFQFHRMLIWDKGTVTPNRWFMPQTELGLYMWRGQAKAIRNCSASQMVRVKLSKETPHPTEKPVALMHYWMGLCSDQGDLVIDPFMGTGSTMVAAARSGRRGVGIELNPQFFDIAVSRVKAALTPAQAELI